MNDGILEAQTIEDAIKKLERKGYTMFNNVKFTEILKWKKGWQKMERERMQDEQEVKK